HRNGVEIARIAEQSGIQALAVHGRTRSELYTGEAEYATIARIREAISIPLFANGDIDSPEKASQVLRQTGADAVMIGRAAQRRPWIFREIVHYLQHGEQLPEPGLVWQQSLLLQHLDALQESYSPQQGVRIARKHVGWQLEALPGAEEFRRGFNRMECGAQQRQAIADFFNRLMDGGLAA